MSSHNNPAPAIQGGWNRNNPLTLRVKQFHNPENRNQPEQLLQRYTPHNQTHNLPQSELFHWNLTSRSQKKQGYYLHIHYIQ